MNDETKRKVITPKKTENTIMNPRKKIVLTMPIATSLRYFIFFAPVV